MPGPNSAPNGDTTIIRGHVDEEFVNVWYSEEINGEIYRWSVPVPKREYLAKRNKLRTGKTV